MSNIEEIKNKIVCGDALEKLKELPSDSIDLCITSPPYYGLRNYGVDGQIGLEKTFDEFLKKILDITAEIKRVLKPTGQFWLNFGDVYASEGTEESRFYHGDNQGKYKLSNDTYSGRARDNDFQSKCLMMMPERIAIAMCDKQNWILRNKIIWAKQILDFKEKKTKGSVMPTSVKDRFNQTYEDLYFFTKSKKYYSDIDAVRLPVQTFEDRDMGIDREKEYPNAKRNKFAFNYRVPDSVKKQGQPQFRASEEEIKSYRQSEAKKEGMHTFYSHSKIFKPGEYQQNKVNDPRGNHLGGPGSWRDFKDENESFTNPNGKNIPSVWLIGSEPHNFSKELNLPNIDHFAIFPQDLVEIPIKFGTKIGDIVLDPFMGSGTTALVARSLGRNYIGIELSEKYIKIAEKRLAQQIMF